MPEFRSLNVSPKYLQLSWTPCIELGDVPEIARDSMWICLPPLVYSVFQARNSLEAPSGSQEVTEDRHFSFFRWAAVIPSSRRAQDDRKPRVWALIGPFKDFHAS